MMLIKLDIVIPDIKFIHLKIQYVQKNDYI
jgi:hypothetical protein